MGMPYDNTNNNSNEKLTRKHERILNPDVQSFLSYFKMLCGKTSMLSSC